MASKPTIKEIEEYQAGLNSTSYYDENGTASYDVISKPKHYMLFDADYVNSTAYLKEGIEVRDVIEKLADKCYSDGLATRGTSLFISDYVQLMQYLMRFMDKNGVEDLKKARWYLDKMISSY
jgi:hypothetical protein